MEFIIEGKPTEEWRDIKGLEGLYQISNLGRIRSLDNIQIRSNGFKMCKFHKKGQILKTYQSGKDYKKGQGYETVTIYDKRYKIHRLVAQAFIPNPQKLPQVNHIDGNKLNNRADNLEWITNRENMLHSWGIGLREKSRKKARKLKIEQVNQMRKECIPGDKEKGYKPLGRKYGVSPTTVKQIVRKEKWKDVN